MYLNNLVIYQCNGLYYIYTEQQELKGMIYLPPDKQLMYDCKCLDIITKALAIRWGIISGPFRRK